MKILVVTQYVWPESFRINDLIRAWVAGGHDVTVLTGLPNYPAGRLFEGYSWRGPWHERFEGADIHRLPVITRGAHRGVRLVLNYASFVALGIVLGPWLLRRDYDVAFVYGPSPITACIPAIWLRRRRGIPVAFWVQDLWPDTLVATGAVRNPRWLKAVERLSRWIYRHCDLVLATSAGFLPPIRRVCPDVRRLEVLPNWADAYYQPTDLEPAAPERLEMPRGFTIVFAGNLGSSQGLDVVLDAAALLGTADIHWVFIGDGNQRARLEGESRRRMLTRTVHFLGWRKGEAMPRYLSLADALFVSLRQDASFALTIPAKLQSSLAVGRPILAALEGESARVVKESGAGVVVEQGSAEALARGAMMLRDAGREAREAMGARGRAYAKEHFDRANLVATLDRWLGEIVRRTR